MVERERTRILIFACIHDSGYEKIRIKKSGAVHFLFRAASLVGNTCIVHIRVNSKVHICIFDIVLKCIQNVLPYTWIAVCVNGENLLFTIHNITHAHMHIQIKYLPDRNLNPINHFPYRIGCPYWCCSPVWCWFVHVPIW